MAQLNSLLVTGDARFVSTIKGVIEPIECTCSLSNGLLTITLPSGYTWSQLRGHTLTAILADYYDCNFARYKIQSIIPFHHSTGTPGASDSDYHACSITGNPKYLYFVSDPDDFVAFSTQTICQMYVNVLVQHDPRTGGNLDVTDYTETTDVKWSAFIL